MQISSISLSNFKGFYDANGRKPTVIRDLDKYLSRSNNIVLFGGLNGAGKTTLLEALFLCFYGRDAVDLYPSKGAKIENYESYIYALLNTHAKKSGSHTASMCIEITLKDINISGEGTQTVILRRVWEWDSLLTSDQFKNGNLTIYDENRIKLDSIHESEHQHKMNDILKYRVAKFFFFDGEQIKDFAGDPDNEFAIGLKQVLDIDLYETLYDDLKTTRSSILSDYNKDKELDKKLSEKQRLITEKESILEANLAEISELDDEIDELEIAREKIDATSYRITYTTAESMGEYQIKKDRKEGEKDALTAQFIHVAKNDLPVFLANALCKEVIEQLQTETKYNEWQTTRKQIDPKINGIVNDIFDNESPTPDITFTQKTFYKEKLERVIRGHLFDSLQQDFSSLNLIHNLSQTDNNKVVNKLYAVNQDTFKQFQENNERLKDVEIALQRIRQTESKLGSTDDSIKKIFEEKDRISQEIGAKKIRVEFLRNENDSITHEIEILTRDIGTLESRVRLQKAEKQRIDYCERMMAAAKAYQVRFQAKRTKELEDAIFEMWGLLAQKNNQVKKLQIIPERNFEVRLFDYNDNQIDKTKLSAGEKEVFAISLLWALVQVSGKKIPVLVDTPFGRLDSIHRTNIAKHYFAKASHQVILLSQNEEIVDEYYDIIQPAIAQEFTIYYDNASRTHKVKEGYDFKTPAQLA
jgi:DNA sulfur modification protein DndD